MWRRGLGWLLVGGVAAAVAVLGGLPRACAERGARRGGVPAPVPAALRHVTLRLVARCAQPVGLCAPPGDPRLFVVEKGGRVRIVRDGRLLARPFLDVSDRVSRGGEQGLLGLVFDPRFAETGRFWFDYTDRRGDSRLVQMRVSAHEPDRADPASARELLRVEQPYANHNGGQLAIGPDGMLYWGLGDGGAGGDPHDNGQNPKTLLGGIVRLDVRGDGAGGRPYRIPKDNPWADGRGGAPELWAIGLRNPWRFSFDRETGDLWIADVGQNRWEEIDRLPAGSPGGANFGWRWYEGAARYARRGAPPAGLRTVAPVLTYPHPEGCSVTGGYVYRGEALPELRGRYFYADFCGGWIRSVRCDPRGRVIEHLDWSSVLVPPGVGRWSSFGEDARGELYVLSLDGGIYRFERAPQRGGR